MSPVSVEVTHNLIRSEPRVRVHLTFLVEEISDREVRLPARPHRGDLLDCETGAYDLWEVTEVRMSTDHHSVIATLAPAT
jgi:hypothetical protein